MPDYHIKKDKLTNEYKKNLGRITERTLQITLKKINERKTMDFSRGPLPMELDQNVVLQYMAIVYGYAYTCTLHCCPIKMNSLPNDDLGL